MSNQYGSNEALLEEPLDTPSNSTVKEIPYHDLADFMRKGTDGTQSGYQQQGYAQQLFEKAVQTIDDYFDQRLEKARTKEEKKRYLQQQHRATMGYPEEVEDIKTIIQQQIDLLKMHDVPYPNIYRNLVDALYHETWGFGVVSVWYERYPEIGKCRVNGREIRYKRLNEKHRTHEQYQDLKDVYRLIDNLMRNDDGEVMTREKPYAELQLYDGTRVTITQPPMCRVPTIVFRRGNVEQYTLYQQADLRTISREAIPVYRMLVRCGLKIILTGEPGTGKSTFLMSLFMETDPNLVTVTAENAWELNLKARFPDRDITEFEGNDETMVPIIFPRTLRMDPQQYLIGEVREVEAPMFKEACANTTGFVATTMHEKDSTNVPGTLARKELRHTEGLNYRVSLTDYANHIDFVLVFETDEDGITLRNTEIAEIQFNPLDLSVISRRIMWFDGSKWCFADGIDDRLERRLIKKDRRAFEEGMAKLNELVADFPIPEEMKETTLSWG